MGVRLLEQNRSAIGLLKVLLAGCLLLPLTLFVIASWLNYRSAMSDAYRGLERTAEVAREHAGKIFAGQEQVADRVADLVQGMDLDEIRGSEKPLHDAFATVVIKLPQVESVLLADASGEPLVSASVYPVPKDVNVKDRDYYQAVVERGASTYLTNVQTGNVFRSSFLGFAQPWTGADGKLRGVIDVVVTPALFEDFYAALADEGGHSAASNVITLVRADGQLLVRFPSLPDITARALPSSTFMRAVQDQPEAGTYQAESVVDHSTRLFAYRKVPGLPVYVVAGRDLQAVISGWLATMASHLVFGIPSTLALLAITWTALVRTRREETALAQAHREIQRREKAEDALLRSQRLEAVGQMTGGVAHDFNNLLTIILGSAEMLERRPDDAARVRRVSQQIMLAAKRGGEITQQLLAFSRRQFVNPQTVNINACLRDFKPLLERASNESIRVDFTLQSDLHPARLDPGHFEAAILNLVGNARDAMPSGGHITISTRNVSVPDEAGWEVAPGDYVRVSVMDVGSGMDPAIAAKAFEPFFTTKGVGQGTGLGLSQVYGFAKQAGGDARIITTRAEGTTVELLLPRTFDTAGGSASDALQPGQAEKGEIVLVVEDEPVVLATTVESLHDLGYGTITAATAQAALECLRRAERVDVLFSDITMPGGMDGLQLSVEARRLHPKLKVLLTSGYVSGQAQSLDVALLTKPYDRTQLARELRAVLHGESRRVTAES